MTKPAFIKNKEGLYRLRGSVEPDVIIQQAASILLDGIANGKELTKASDAVQFLQLALGNEKNEQFSVLFLSKRHQVLAFENLFQGTIDSAAVYPRVVLQRALHWNAAAIILAHNHPSNDCEPSQSDKLITQQLIDALGLLDIRVLDHFIVSRSNCISLAERGLM